MEINTLHARQSRAMLTTLMLSFGVPMLLGGDEMGRTQNGNNNAYCQDNELTWFDWDSADKDLLDFTRQLIAFRRAHPVFRRIRSLAGAERATPSRSGPAPSSSSRVHAQRYGEQTPPSVRKIKDLFPNEGGYSLAAQAITRGGVKTPQASRSLTRKIEVVVTIEAIDA